MRIVSGGVTDLGRVRTNNEDCFRIVESLNLFVLADGMGGEAHGEVASAMAVETVVKSCIEMGNDTSATLIGASEPTWSEKAKRLTSAVHLANRNIYNAAEANPDHHGMGATLTAAWIDGARLSIAHVGDSRAYLLRSGNLQQLTRDHSLVAEQVRRGILTAAEAEESEMQSVLLRALGALPDIEVDTDEHILFARDILMLCCDGLTRMVTEPESTSVHVFPSMVAVRVSGPSCCVTSPSAFTCMPPPRPVNRPCWPSIVLTRTSPASFQLPTRQASIA